MLRRLRKLLPFAWLCFLPSGVTDASIFDSLLKACGAKPQWTHSDFPIETNFSLELSAKFDRLRKKNPNIAERSFYHKKEFWDILESYGDDPNLQNFVRKKIVTLYGDRQGSKIISKMAPMGEKHLRLAVEPGIGTRLDEFVAFIGKHPALQSADTFAVREAFRQDLGPIKLYRAIRTGYEITSIEEKAGFLSEYTRQDVDGFPPIYFLMSKPYSLFQEIGYQISIAFKTEAMRNLEQFGSGKKWSTIISLSEHKEVALATAYRVPRKYSKVYLYEVLIDRIDVLYRHSVGVRLQNENLLIRFSRMIDGVKQKILELRGNDPGLEVFVLHEIPACDSFAAIQGLSGLIIFRFLEILHMPLIFSIHVINPKTVIMMGST